MPDLQFTPTWLTPSVRSLLAPNPGPMTLAGTNTYIIGSPEAGAFVVIDPGPALEAHIARLSECGPIALVLVTHHHRDHAGAIDRLVELTGAAVRAVRRDLCRSADPVRDGERIRVGEIEIVVMATPGHTSDSVSFVFDDGRRRSVFTGDTILGGASTVILDPDGSLTSYFSSLESLRGLGDATVFPGHGPVLPRIDAAADACTEHRHQRLTEIRRVLERAGLEAAPAPETVAAVAASVYADIDPSIRAAADATVRAQLAYLARE